MLSARCVLRYRTSGFLQTSISEKLEGESDVKLYNWQSAPNCRLVRMFILEKGMDLPEIEEVGGPPFAMVA
jgi:hypothetical protein